MPIPAVLQHGADRSFSKESAGATAYPSIDLDVGANRDLYRAIECGAIGWVASHYARYHTVAMTNRTPQVMRLSPIGPVINPVERHARPPLTAIPGAPLNPITDEG